MEFSQEIDKLVNKYIKQIEIEDTGFYPVDGNCDEDVFGKPDAACIDLIVPITMLKEYLKLKGQRKKLPNPEEFWKDTNLIDKLSKYYPRDKIYYPEDKVNQSPLEDVLYFLGICGEIGGQYQDLFTRPGYIRVSVFESKKSIIEENTL